LDNLRLAGMLLGTFNEYFDASSRVENKGLDRQPQASLPPEVPTSPIHLGHDTQGIRQAPAWLGFRAFDFSAHSLPAGARSTRYSIAGASRLAIR